jgi:putative secretion ATPase (PEP-CTERM system associated)
MYERFYQLRERPFALGPDPEYLYPSRVHREALSYLRFGIEGHAGFVVITGEIGSGKTTLLQTLLRGLDSETTVARIVNTMLDPRELLESILLDFGLDVPAGKPAMLRRLAEFLVHEREAGRLVLLVVDEAQNLGLDALEEVRMLSNLETEKSKLIQIILVGQPDLRETLARPELEQLRQRITVSYHLSALDRDETAAYVNHRLERAANGEPIVFPREVTDLVHARSAGVPRLINVICDAILLVGYGDERRTVDLALAREAVEELETSGVLEGVQAPPRPAAVMRQTTAHAEPKAPAPAIQPARAPGPAVEDPRREDELRERDAAISERERALAEQRRVLAEQFRLQRPAEPSSRMAPAPVAASWPPVAVAHPAAPTQYVTRFDPEPPRSLWDRVRRAIGGPAAALDERS